MPRTPTQSDWNRFARAADKRAAKLVTRYAAEEITAVEFGEQFHSLLADRHGRAGYLGRRRGGADWDFDDDDAQFGELIAEDEREFLDQFVLDLTLGRYRKDKGEPDTAAMTRRAQMYTRKLRGTANEAFVGTSSAKESIYWVLTGKEHCSDCPERAASSPHTAETLPGNPGDGNCECLTACNCYLRREEDNRTGFKAL